MLIYDSEKNVVLNHLDMFKDKKIRMSTRYFSQDGDFVCLLYTFVKLTGDPMLHSWFGNMIKSVVDLPALDSSSARKKAFEKALDNAGIPLPEYDKDALDDELVSKVLSIVGRALTEAQYLSIPAKKYREKVDVITAALPAEKLRQARTRITLACWMFDRMPGEITAGGEEELIAIWRGENRPYFEATNGMQLQLEWPCPPDAGTLALKTIVNPASSDIAFEVCHALAPNGVSWTIRLPERRIINALFAGDRLACLKGLIACNNDYAFIMTDEGLERCDLRTFSHRRYDVSNADGLTSFADDDRRRIHMLYGNTLRLSEEIDEYSPLRRQIAESRVIEVFAQGGAVVALDSRGASMSNIESLSGLDVSAAVELPGNGLYVLTRKGALEFCPQKSRAVKLSAEELLKRHMSRFEALAVADVGDMVRRWLR